jgi:hypothetical protein
MGVAQNIRFIIEIKRGVERIGINRYGDKADCNQGPNSIFSEKSFHYYHGPFTYFLSIGFDGNMYGVGNGMQEFGSIETWISIVGAVDFKQTFSGNRQKIEPMLLSCFFHTPTRIGDLFPYHKLCQQSAFFYSVCKPISLFSHGSIEYNMSK